MEEQSHRVPAMLVGSSHAATSSLAARPPPGLFGAMEEEDE